MSEYEHEVVRSKGYFDQRSFRYKKVGDHRVLVGCRKGKFKRGRCQVGTRAYKILHPKGEANPCPVRRRVR